MSDIKVVKSLGHVVLEHPEETRVVKSLGHVVLRAPIQATTRQPSNVSETQASLRGYFDGGIIATVNAHFEYKKVGDVSWSTTATEEVPTEEVFSADIVTEANESYEFRAVVDTGADLYYGEIVTFNAVWIREGSQEDFERGILDGVEVIDDKLQLVADGELGTRQKPYHIPEAKQGEISWEATTPAGTDVAIEAQVQGTTVITDEAVGTGDGTTKVFYLDHWPADTPTVTVNAVSETGFTLGDDRRTITFTTAPADTHAILASYTAVDDPVDDAVEIQTLDLDSPAGGTFKLGDGTSWTSDIAYDASAADIETALEGLYGTGKVEVERVAKEILETYTTVGSHSWTVPAGVNIVDVLVVAGGGGGGSRYGGGGAGGLIFRPAFSVPPDANITVTVGDGGSGAAGDGGQGNNGQDSVFGDLTAKGGGGGGGQSASSGRDGGSGGGCGSSNNTNTGTGIQPNQTGDSGAFGHGEDGGVMASGGGGGTAAGGGGGGASEAGHASSASNPGDGGDGLDFSSIFGTAVGDDGWFAGGGGGSGAKTNYASVGGKGGGADGKDGHDSQLPDNALSNTGGGGAGGPWDGSGLAGSNGGSGIVIIALPKFVITFDLSVGNSGLVADFTGLT